MVSGVDERGAAALEHGHKRISLPSARSVRITSTWATRYVQVLFFIDVLSGVASSALAFMARFGLERHDHVTAHRHIYLALAVPVLWLASTTMCRAYEERFAGSGSEDVKRMVNAAVRSLAGVALISYAFRLDLARGFVFPALLIAVGLSLAGRAVMRASLSYMRRRGRWVNRVVVVGAQHAADRLVHEIRRRPDTGHLVVGTCLAGAHDQVARADVPRLGGTQDILGALREVQADTVAVAACHEMDGPALRSLAWQLEGTGVDLLVAPLLTDIAGGRIHVRPVSGLPLLHVEEPELSGGRHLTKMVFDTAAAALGLLFLSPVLLLIAVAIKADSRGPVLFRQTRVGKDGRFFRIVKFRSMVNGADQRVIDLSDHNMHANGPLFKIENDPRVTRLGTHLRRFSLDELPQLINVLLGHMSLVGPRPPLPSEVLQYEVDVTRRLLVKPGLTGLWQVSGRADLPWEEAVRLDLHYVENWSLAQDVAILLRTVQAVLRRSGAY